MKNNKMKIISVFSLILLLGISSMTLAAEKTFMESLSDSTNLDSLNAKPLTDDGIIHTQVKKDRNDKDIDVNVIMDQKKMNKNSLEKYKKQMPNLYKKLEKQGYKSLPSTVTLNDLLTFDEFETLLSNYNIEVNRIFVQTQTSDGTLGAFTIALNNNTINMEDVNAILDGPVDIQVNGVYAFKTSIPTNTSDFANLSNNNNVYMVDVSHLEIENNVKISQAFKKELQNDPDTFLDVNVFDFYYELKSNK